jgi:hypothetical protein
MQHLIWVLQVVNKNKVMTGPCGKTDLYEMLREWLGASLWWGNAKLEDPVPSGFSYLLFVVHLCRV